MAAADYVASLNSRLMLKEVVEWVGYDRAAMVAVPIGPPLAGLGQLRMWLDGQPIPHMVEARLRALLQIVLVLEPKRGLEPVLEVLDRPMLGADIRLLLLLAAADEALLDYIIQQVEEAANED